MDEIKLLEKIRDSLRRDPDIPHFGCTLDEQQKTLSITIVSTQENFVITCHERRF